MNTAIDIDSSDNLCFLGHKYEIRILNEGTDQEKVVIFKRQKNVDGEWTKAWDKPLVIGG